MPHFHLNLVNGEGESPDDEGQDFPHLSAARAEAIRGIRSLLASEVSTGTVDLGGRIEVANAAGEVLETISFAEALEIRR